MAAVVHHMTRVRNIICNYILFTVLMHQGVLLVDAQCSAHCSGGCAARGPGSCDICDLGYGLDVGTPRTCHPCDPNCAVACQYAGQAKCDGFCKPGYTFNGITKKCDYSGGSTLTCSSNCGAGCNSAGQGSCDRCDSGYGLNNGSPKVCQACDPNCANGCYSAGAGLCDGSCNSGYQYDPSNRNCKVVQQVVCSSYCSAGCSSAGSGSCDRCDFGYGLNQAFPKTCQACDPNCANGCQSNGAGKCDGSCKSGGYTFDSSSKTCITASSGCSAHCSGGCAARGPGSCDTCDFGYGLDVGTPRTCQPCDPNCAVACQYAGQAKCDGFCKPGYTFNGITKKCDSGSGTLTCSSNCAAGCTSAGQGSCDRCDNGYGLNNGSPKICQACDRNCANGCSNAGAGLCDGSCIPGYQYDSSNRNCKVVQQVVCSSYCSAGCSSAGSGSCDRCDYGYGLNQASPKTCQACDPNCANGCQNNGAGKCDGSCKSGGFTYSSSSQTCVTTTCDPNCANGCQSNGAGKCDGSCKSSDYKFDSSSKTCLACDPNCANGCQNNGAGKCDGSCKSGGFTFDSSSQTCRVGPTTCSPGFIYDSSTGRCVENKVLCSSHCSSGCIQSGGGSCDKCDSGYGLNQGSPRTCQACDSYCTNGCTSNGAGKCDGSCISGYTFDSSTFTCKQLPGSSQNCSAHCLGCQSAGVGSCDMCDSGYGLSAKTPRICVACDPNCVSQCAQAGGGKCDSKCISGYVYDSTSRTCQRCDIKCISGCDISGPGKCDGQCQPNYGPTGPTGSKTCAMCSQNCAKGCNTAGGGSCDQCVDGYGLTDSTPQICQLCDFNCAGVCKRAGRCDSKCKQGYELNSGTGTCVVSTTSPNQFPECDPNCEVGCVIAGKGKCDGQCVTNYGITFSRTCTMCSANCAQGCKISGGGSCDGCSPGYGTYDSQPRTCGLCQYHCADVCGNSGAGKCDALCEVNYVLLKSQSICIPEANSGRKLSSNLSLSGILAAVFLIIRYRNLR